MKVIPSLVLCFYTAVTALVFTGLNKGNSIITSKNPYANDTFIIDGINTHPDWFFGNGIVVLGKPPLISHSGPILTGKIPLYVVYYGLNFAYGGSQQNYVVLLDNLFYGLSRGSSWYDQAKSFAPNVGRISFSGINVVVTGYTYGKSLADGDIRRIINDQIIDRRFKLDGNAIYLVITDNSVSERAGSATYGVNFCGYHGHINNLKYAFVGTGSPRCKIGPFNYKNQQLFPVNGGDIDAAASVSLHEITETVTDPFGNAWLDSAGYENADECNFVFGAAMNYPTLPHTIYNLQVGSEYYMVQQNYNQKVRGCQQVTYTS